MENSEIAELTAELQRRAEEKFGSERAKALQDDLRQLAAELRALQEYNVGFDDEP